ncbi:MAG: rhodanese-like domain-containing protein [Oligoflexia bacterium]|nr:rhodanese-like domain-containing protein [Oligoflexia bacterium]
MSSSHPDWIITPAELHAELSLVKLIDVREPEEYEECRIEGGKLIPLGELMARASELDPDDNLVLYCAHGVRSVHALLALKSLGFTKLRSLEGGIVEWQAQGF